MPAVLSRPWRTLAVIGALAALVGATVAAHTATAQSASGTVTGRVLWGACIRAIPLPMTPEGQVQPGAPEVMPPGPPSRPNPGPVNGLPAGAVLVAVQNTAVSTRTDEAG